MGRSHRQRRPHKKGSYGKAKIRKHKGSSKRKRSVNQKRLRQIDDLSYEEQLDGRSLP